MEEILEAYVKRIGPFCAGLDEKTGHLIASMLTAYTMGLGERVVSRADEVLEAFEKQPDIPPLIGRAVLILRDNAQTGSAAPVRSEYTFAGESVGAHAAPTGEGEVTLRFEAGDADYFAIQLPPDEIEVPDALERDNALFLLFAVAYGSSPMDRQSLEEHLERLLIKRWKIYHKRR
jgi:hypothetical protein